MPLDPQARQFLDLVAALNVPEYGTVPIADSRRDAAQRRAAMPPGPEALVADYQLARANGRTCLMRLYKPVGSATPLPLVVWFHGGGWVVGSVVESDGDCRHLTVQSGCAVLSVDYALAPEYPQPTALEDCYAALEWAHANAALLGVDRERIAVGGDSAGANLATCTALLARERNGPALAFQVLIYPVTDITRFDRPSYVDNAEGYFLTRKTMRWFADQYCPHVPDRAHPNVSPLFAADLRGVPPAFVATAEFDPLRDEGEAYAERLREAGVPVDFTRCEGMIHGCFSLHPFLEGGKRLLAATAHALRTRLRP